MANKKSHLLFFSIPLIIASLVFVSSCSKENKAPVITFEEPEVGAIDTIPNETHIEGSTTDDDGLNNINVFVFNAANDTLMKDTINAAGAKEKRFHYHYTATAAGSYSAQVVASDIKGLTATKSVGFTVVN